MDLNMGETYRYKGDFSRSRRLFRAAYETLGEVGDLANQTLAVANEGQVLLSMNQLDKARAALEEGDRLALQVDPNGEDETMTTLLCEIHHGLAVIYLAQNDLHKAWDSAYFALKVAQRGKQPMQRGFANRAAGEVITALETSPDPELASDPDEYFRAASEAFREIELEGELARTMFAHARSLARRGKGVTAARKLQQVMIIFSKLGMSDDAAKAAELQRRVI
jgi:tetratricopeptide (TPR) repeat protein